LCHGEAAACVRREPLPRYDITRCGALEVTAAGVPTLVVQGRHDTHVEPAGPRAYATATGAAYVDVDAGHFALLVRSEVVEREVREFIALRLP
jgi:pimeloyl-ACP methyl ester carboxylesterase